MQKRFLPLCITCILLVCTCAIPAFAQTHNWFFKPNGNNAPELLGGNDVWREYGAIALNESGEKVLYLTFDAGYENGNVAKTLDVLQKHDAKAAFFILPGLIKHNPEIVTRMADEGHLVCNHSTTHGNMSHITDASAFEKELRGIENAYTELTGKQLAPYFRPPEGSFSENTLAFCKQFGYTPVFWSYAYADWDNNNQMSPDKALEKLLANLHPGEVLLLHPNSATNAAILDDFLTEAKNRGYRFGTLDEFPAETASVQIDDLKEQGLVFCENRNAGKFIALTFDDGPHQTQTDEILAVLQKYGVKATFFPIGQNIAAHPDVTRRVHQAGHEIGNHTYTHAAVSKLTDDRLTEELDATAALLKEQCGVTPTVFRPPGGDISEGAVRLVNALGYRYVLWSWRVDTRDWASVSVDSVINTVLDNVRDGDVILFHDYVAGVSPTAKALETLIPALRARGYEFVTVSELAAM